MRGTGASSTAKDRESDTSSVLKRLYWVLQHGADAVDKEEIEENVQREAMMVAEHDSQMKRWFGALMSNMPWKVERGHRELCC